MTGTVYPDQSTLQTRRSWLSRPLLLGISPAGVALGGILLGSLLLHVYDLGAIGDANAYYTAAVESMLDSWHNFFFVAAEPGGSVTVDKPPLGLWIEAAFAWVFGVSGAAGVLPNIIAGLLSIAVLYWLVKTHFGAGAGLLAALLQALTPVALAADRNNTMDSMLTLTLLLAAWAFIRATESGKGRFVILGAVLLGLGFNIKMLQVLLPVPAFYALYFLGAKQGWLRKLANLAFATGVMVLIAFSWALIVDAVPAESRPYIGSSTDNSVMQLILGHNGASRIFGGRASGNAPAMTGPLASPGRPQPPPQGADQQLPQGRGLPAGQGSGGFNFETGEAGLMRFFEAPLAKEMSWLLPFGLVSVLLATFSGPVHLPLRTNIHQGLLLWGGWLLTCLIFFSFAGLFHAYYMVMLAPALAACVALGASLLATRADRNPLRIAVILALTAVLTLGFQVYLLSQYAVSLLWAVPPVALLGLGIGGILLYALGAQGERIWKAAGFGAIFAALLLIPLGWSVMTVLDDSASVNLPAAYAGEIETSPSRPGSETRRVDADLLAYLEANTRDVEYLMAVPSAQIGAPYVLETARPVLYMGGFSGGDPVVAVQDLEAMVANEELRFFYLSKQGRGNQTEIASWLAATCTVIPKFSQGLPPGGPQSPGSGNRLQSPAGGATTLYDCLPQDE